MKLQKRLGIGIIIFLLLIASGSLIYQRIEGWNFLDSLYFTTITVTTIGYGDFSPATNIGKIFTIVFALAGISVVLYLLSLVGRSIFSFDFKKNNTARKGVIKIRK